jgi:Amt family ammonium transporter
MAVIGVLWVLSAATAMAFGHQRAAAWTGLERRLRVLALSGIDHTESVTATRASPSYVFAMFQGKFAIITVALISGALAERVRFRSYLAFHRAVGLLVYSRSATGCGGRAASCASKARSTSPAARWCTSRRASAALCGAILLGKRNGPGRGAMLPHKPRGDADRRRPAVVRLVRLQRRLGALERQRHRRPGLRQHAHGGGRGRLAAGSRIECASTTASPPALGAASGLVAGLVAITPAAGFVTPSAALIIGLRGAGVHATPSSSRTSRLRRQPGRLRRARRGRL